MELFNSIFSWFIKKRIHQIGLFKKYPSEVQSELLERLLKKSSHTVYGKKYSFRSITSYERFKEQVPIVNYEDIFPYIKRIMKGEKNILWASDIKWFAKSSGTTNDRSKFIPVSQEAMEDCHFKGGKDLLSIYVNNYSESKIFSGKGLVVGGSYQLNPFNTQTKTYYGDVSSLLLKNLPWWAQMIRTPKLDIALMDEWETKIEKMIDLTMNENVTSISGVPTWMVVLLEKIMRKHRVSSILDIWPNLEVFFHGGVAFTPYKNLFKRLIPSPKMRYVETYNASEGFFAIQDQIDSKDMLLMLDYDIFYEFIPQDKINEENPTILPLDEVEINKLYAMVITTNAGLWRYQIGDTIKFTSLTPYRIKISGRTKLFINAFGEELMIENAEIAMAIATKKTNAEIDNFTAAPIYFHHISSKEKYSKGGHEWIVEFIKKPDNLERFTQILDEELREINSDYDTKRYKDIALQLPLIRSVPPKTFYRWMKSKKKLGGQNKVPRLSNDRTIIDDILRFMKTT